MSTPWLVSISAVYLSQTTKEACPLPFIPCSNTLNKLVEDYKEAAKSGEDFHEVPAAVFKEGVRQYGHPMTANWAINHQATILQDPKVQQFSQAGGAERTVILTYLQFADETILGTNISAFPMSLYPAHTSLQHIHSAFASARAVVAYIPIPLKPPGSTPAEFTERVCAMHAKSTDLVRKCLS